MNTDSLVLTRAPEVLGSDPGRVITRLFVPGLEHLVYGESRASTVLDRIVAMEPAVVSATLADTMERFGGRHRDLPALFAEHFAMVAHRLGADSDLPEETRLLVGAYFTHEYSVEAAALFNPSIVPHPDQAGVAAGKIRAVLSLRAVGEGHLSSIEFRSVVIAGDGGLEVEDPGRYLITGHRHEPLYRRALFHGVLDELGDDGEDAAYVLDSLPEQFTPDELEQALARLRDQILTRRSADQTIEKFRSIASSTYEVRFPPSSALGERVLMPAAPAESNGMEDARFVRFTDDDGVVTYYATYTAFDGRRVAPHLLETLDFETFNVSQLSGPAAANKGMALFPRRIAGRFVALSRWDRENNAIARSIDARTWGEPTTVQTPRYPWEFVQIGNCGSPLETSAGWLVLTHGVGPMRTYAIGALLLDLDDPSRVVGQLSEPLLRPVESEREGYVPNVVYSCGALIHGDRLILPYGSADARIGVAVIDLPGLLKQMS